MHRVITYELMMQMARSKHEYFYVRVALVTEEGLWVGEQRCRRSSLEIELPPGDYQMIVEEPAPLAPSPAGCMAMGVSVSLAPFTSVARSQRPGEVTTHSVAATLPGFLGPGLGLGAHCDSLGALPLPLDVISSTGGSLGFGGPIDGSGRLLLRRTDIHDGRKKVFMRVPARSLIRIAVVSANAESVEVVLEDSGHQPVVPVHTHILGSAGISSRWVSFHREHRIAAGAGCASFDWLLQVTPSADLAAMTECWTDSGSLQDLSTKAADAFRESAVATADARVNTGQSGGTSSSIPLTLADDSLVEAEVQFNFMLSNIHLWLETSAGASGGPVEASGPAIAAHGIAASPRNAQAVLQLRLAAGQHTIRIRSGRCVPLGVRLRRVALHSSKPVVGPFLAAPLSSGADFVLSITTPTGDGETWLEDCASSSVMRRTGFREPRPPSLAGLPPTATSAVKGAATGGLVAAWSGTALSLVALTGGRAVEPAPPGASRLWALPLRFEGEGSSLRRVPAVLIIGRPKPEKPMPMAVPTSSPPRLLGRVSCDDLTVKDVLGKGGLARVLLVQTDVLKEGKGLNVALKCVFRPVLEDAQSLRAEAEIMERCSRGFDNIPKVLGWLEPDTGLTGFLLQACGPPLQVAAATMDVAEFARALRCLEPYCTSIRWIWLI
eukprot:s2388_g1.t4